LGTGSFVDMNTGNQAYSSKHGLYPMIGWKIGDETTFIIEGTDRNAGSVLEWGRDLGMYSEVPASDSLAQSVPDTNSVYFVPAFSGLGHPVHDDRARGTLVGVKRDSKKEHVVRALLEGICFRVKDMVDVIVEDLPKVPMRVLRADGGVCNNNFIMQFTSDLLPMKIQRAAQREMTGQGVAFLAGLAVGMWKSKDELKALHKVDRVFEPNEDNLSDEQRARKVQNWKRAVSRSLHWDN